MRGLGLIYMVTSPSGKAYIGQTRRGIQSRKSDHELSSRNGSSLLLHQAIRKYGESLNWFIVADGVPVDHLDVYERCIIEHLGTLAPDGYNLDITL